MNYEEARAYIREASKSGSVLGLESIIRLMEELDNVQDDLPIIHIAGTNGKGSVGAYLASIFMQAGLHVGRYCSPAVFSPLEVWQYDGTFILETEYASVMSQVKNACDIVVSKGYPSPTVFEIETAAAFVYFSMKKPDVVLLEVGMGGLTDATNLIKKPMASVITTISMDHMQFLGQTLDKIAAVKAGIIKKNCPVFSASQECEVRNVIEDVAKNQHAPLVMVKEAAVSKIEQKPGVLSFTYESKKNGLFSLSTKMAGSYQMRNATLAVEVACSLIPVLLNKKEDSDAVFDAGRNKKIIEEGVANATWPGRFEVIGTNPLFIMDGAHNEDAAKCLLNTIQNCFTNAHLTYIIGVLADKEHEKMLKLLLPLADIVYTVTPNNPRALDGEVLASEAKKYFNEVYCCDTIADAVDKAICHATIHNTPILAFGSLSYLQDIKEAYRKSIRV